MKKIKTKNQKDQIIILEWKYFLIQFDKQLQKLNNKFNYQVIDLLSLSIGLIPKDANKFFDTLAVCLRMQKKKKKIKLFFPIKIVSK